MTDHVVAVGHGLTDDQVVVGLRVVDEHTARLSDDLGPVDGSGTARVLNRERDAVRRPGGQSTDRVEARRDAPTVTAAGFVRPALAARVRDDRQRDLGVTGDLRDTVTGQVDANPERDRLAGREVAVAGVARVALCEEVLLADRVRRRIRKWL